LNEKKNHLPERGIELTTLQISQKQGKSDLNAITTWPPSLMFLSAPNWKIAQYLTKFHYIKALKSIFDPFPTVSHTLHLCQIDPFGKTQLLL